MYWAGESAHLKVDSDIYINIKTGKHIYDIVKVPVTVEKKMEKTHKHAHPHPRTRDP